MTPRSFAQCLGSQWTPRSPDQIRRRPSARGTLQFRQHSTEDRPDVGGPLQPPHGQRGENHNSALRHVSTVLLTRIIVCWRRGTPYLIRDVDGTPLMPDEARRIVQERYHVSEDLRAKRKTTGKGTSRRSKESQSAPSTGPSISENRTKQVA
jgi:uncharacterized protein YbaR (Trm112 family)